MNTAIIGGSSLFTVDVFNGFKPRAISTKYGEAYVLEKDNVVFLPRHGKNRHIPPHKINNLANISALKMLGVKRIFSFNSVGSLKLNIPPGSIVVPDDYISFCDIPTFFSDKIVHTLPNVSEELRKELIKIAKKLKLKYYNGVYIQTSGPRLETKAEINMLKHFGDVVGMTLASEAACANELEIPIASLSTVDNYCNGISKKELSIELIEKHRINNTSNIKKILQEMIS